MSEHVPDGDGWVCSCGYYKTKTDKELGEQLGGITSQAVGQQRRRILRNLYETARRDPSFPTLNVNDEGELR